MTVSYNGAQFSGWQIQPGAITVQSLIEEGITSLLCMKRRIHASGRTDAGVHALGQVFHVDIPDTCTIPLHHWERALNSKLPHSIRIVHIEEVSSGFHSRFSAKNKTYQYHIVTSQTLSPFDFGRVLHHPAPKIDLDILKKCIHTYKGTHDFYSFCAKRGNEPTDLPANFYIRTILHSEIEIMDDKIIIIFTGTGFLYKMVRLMVGSALAVSTGKMSFNQFLDYLNRSIEEKTKYAVAPEGLYLSKVSY